MDIIIFVFINSILIVFAVLAAKFWGLLGTFGGLFGAALSYLALTSANLIINTVYDQTAQVFVYQLYPMGMFAFIPVVLTGLNFVVAIKRK